MRILWHEQGNRLYKRGTIVREKVNFIWWILDRWFDIIHNLWGKIPYWDTFWVKISPHWGDPFCAAYCFVWSNFYYSKVKQDFSIEIGFDRLSPDFREWYEKENLFV